MCFNSNVSLATYISGMIGCIILLMKKDYISSVFFACVIQMQLIEYFLWKNQNCSDKNKLISKFGVTINHIEPIILWFAILVCSKLKLPYIVNMYMAMFFIVTIFYTKYIAESIECTMVTNVSYPHLHWKWNHKKHNLFYYILFIIALIVLLYFGVKNKYFLMFITLISYFVSYLIYGNKKVTGAMWCFLAAFAPWIVLLYNKLTKYKY